MGKKVREKPLAYLVGSESSYSRVSPTWPELLQDGWSRKPIRGHRRPGNGAELHLLASKHPVRAAVCLLPCVLPGVSPSFIFCVGCCLQSLVCAGWPHSPTTLLLVLTYSTHTCISSVHQASAVFNSDSRGHTLPLPCSFHLTAPDRFQLVTSLTDCLFSWLQHRWDLTHLFICSYWPAWRLLPRLLLPHLFAGPAPLLFLNIALVTLFFCWVRFICPVYWFLVVPTLLNHIFKCFVYISHWRPAKLLVTLQSIRPLDIVNLNWGKMFLNILEKLFKP